VEYIYAGDAHFEPPIKEAADGSFQPAPIPHSPHVLLIFGWCLHVGGRFCDCAQTCDKSYTGMFFDGCVCRWAVAHFGQKPAVSPLNCIALCLHLHAALRAPVVGELRGYSLIIGGQTRADFVHTVQTMQTFQTLQDHRK
jgi:hypothetical protein